MMGGLTAVAAVALAIGMTTTAQAFRIAGRPALTWWDYSAPAAIVTVGLITTAVGALIGAAAWTM